MFALRGYKIGNECGLNSVDSVAFGSFSDYRGGFRKQNEDRSTWREIASAARTANGSRMGAPDNGYTGFHGFGERAKNGLAAKTPGTDIIPLGF